MLSIPYFRIYIGGYEYVYKNQMEKFLQKTTYNIQQEYRIVSDVRNKASIFQNSVTEVAKQLFFVLLHYVAFLFPDFKCQLL